MTPEDEAYCYLSFILFIFDFQVGFFPFPFLEVINYHRFSAAIRILKARILKEHLYKFSP